MYNSFRSLTCSVLFATVFGVSTAQAFQLLNERAPLVAPDKCLAPKSGDTSNGTPLVGTRCNTDFGQQWNWESFGIQGIGTNSQGSRCVDVAGSGKADQTPVQLFACNGTGAQQWVFSNGRIVNPQSGKCLDIFDDAGVTMARIRTCGGIDPVGQTWVIR
jgi:hypothetical protein